VHKKAIVRLQDCVNEALDGCFITSGWPTLPESSKTIYSLVAKTKDKWITPAAVYSSLVSKILSYLRTEGTDWYDLNGKLNGVLSAEEIEALKKEIVEYFSSIPRSYVLKMPLPTPPEIIDRDIALSDTISLEYENSSRSLSQTPTLGLLAGVPEKKLFLSVNLLGHTTFDIDSFCPKETLSIYKVIIHQALHRELFELKNGGIRPTYIGHSHQIPKSILQSLDTGNPEEQTNISLPINLCIFISQLCFKHPCKNIEQIQSLLQPAISLTQSSESEAKRVRAAIEWSFDALVNDNENLAFLQVCFGFEALLGEGENKAGLTETLADRCAFLIGTSIKGRAKIKKNFKELYRVRSKLVHGVVNSLSEEEKKYFYWGQTVLNTAIAKELKHLNL